MQGVGKNIAPSQKKRFVKNFDKICDRYLSQIFTIFATPDSARSKIWEDIVMMYLSRIVSKSMISFSAYKSSVNPDFIIETRDCPIVVEVGTKKTTTKQLSKYRQKIRYGILINAGATEIEFNDKNQTLILPMSWFLMI